jgi:hypothetical protein
VLLGSEDLIDPEVAEHKQGDQRQEQKVLILVGRRIHLQFSGKLAWQRDFSAAAFFYRAP